jgi:hypothetical protein
VAAADYQEWRRQVAGPTATLPTMIAVLMSMLLGSTLAMLTGDTLQRVLNLAMDPKPLACILTK